MTQANGIARPIEVASALTVAEITLGARPRVYLAGPMKGLSVESATGWRNRIAEALSPEIVCYSPMRQVAECATDRVEASYEHHVLHNSRALTARDRIDVQRADLVIANLVTATSVSIGTCIEVGWCDAWRIPLVLILGKDGPHEHPMIREAAGWIVRTEPEAVYVARSVLLP